MKISTKGRYGIRALLDVALINDGRLVPLKDISRRQEISLHYLERIVAPLVRAGFLKSTRGPSGGVMLAMQPEDIKVIEVIDILEGSVAPVACVDDPNTCHRFDSCATCDLWLEVKKAIEDVLGAVTLQDLVDRHEMKQQESTAKE